MEVLKEIGKILAEGVKNDPSLAAIALLVLIAAATLIQLRAEKKLPWFFGLVAVAICAVVFIARTEVNRQKERLTMLPSVEITANPNAVPIIDQLTENQKEDIRKILGKAAQDAANALGIPSHLIRANVFSPGEHEKLRIIKQLTHNMDRLEELEISIPVGKGSTGRSFLSGQPNIAVFNEGWGPNTPGELEIPKVHPDLQMDYFSPGEGKSRAYPPHLDNEYRLPEGPTRRDATSERPESPLPMELHHLSNHFASATNRFPETCGYLSKTCRSL